MADEFKPGDFVTFIRQGGIPVSVQRYGGTFVRIAQIGGKQVTYVRHGGTPISVDNEKNLPPDIKEELGVI